MQQRQDRTAPSLLGRLRRHQGGAIAPMAAVVMGTMVVGTGAAIDISRLISARSQLQDAVDGANLALARMPASTTDSAMKAKAQAWISANVTSPDITGVTVDTPTRSTGQVQLNVSAKVATTFTSLLGMSTLPIEGHSTVKYGTTHVELALVLDNTGSMNDDGKLASLKTAAKTLVNTLSDSAKVSGDQNALKVGIVPFSMAVNVGAQNQAVAVSAGYLTGSMPAEYGSGADAVDSSHPDRFTLLKNMGVNWGGCVESRPMPYDVQDTPPTPSNKATQFVPFFAPDEPDQGYYQYQYGGKTYMIPNYGSYQNAKSAGGSYYSENNYLPDNYTGTSSDNINDSSKGGNWLGHQTQTSKYKQAPLSGSSPVWSNAIGPNAGCTVQAIQPLTTDTSTVLSQIDTMVAGGDTEIPLGLVWGWHVLSPYAPFASGVAYGTSGTVKVIVLVTDGANTYGSSPNLNQSHYTAYGYAANKRISSDGTASGTASALNDRLTTLCNNMKVKNSDGSWRINVYAVPLEVTDTNIKGLLQGCVTDPSNYIDVSSSSGLQDAFANIAGSISALRVAH